MLRCIDQHDHPLHSAFCHLMRQVFTRSDFSRWIEWGEWGQGYRVLAWQEGDQLLASVGVTRMSMIIHGESIQADQWGAVACHPDHRGRGLSRHVLEAAIKQAGARPIFLYANPNVREFYPRFGFRPLSSYRFRWNCELEPAAPAATLLDLHSAEQRAQLHNQSTGIADSFRLSATHSSRIASWYYANGFARPLRRVESSLVCAGVNAGVLYIDGWFGARPTDCRATLAALIDQPVRSVEFGFYPDACLPDKVLSELAAVMEPEADLFVRGFDCWPAEAGLSPLART
ncbi:GNAT family N-acetyltransferase [Pseudomarimonas arenosa]|uniref:GNAT family N-acetyltransferase n=1 Tax=Pseudomarimonas arenosa TaxID=2774145 RepID=A0AAW3ZPU2_9GAMM|nr:GNAT family N-acetyltransferase [Pseudomarimonas arenosa]MBD8527184.1 GNAT family N-acetyltransferase [Pseudomarimonas arenosa]